MRNIEKWRPTKYVYKKGRLRASRNPAEVSVASRLVADLSAKLYDKLIKEYAKGRLLDLGCGKIPLYEAYKDYVDKVTCIDWENSAHLNVHLDSFADLNEILPLSDNDFDTIILSSVLEHIKEPNLLWKEMNRILSDGGILLMNVPFLYQIHEEPYDFYRYTHFALKQMAEQSDFKIISLNPYGGAPEVLTDIFSKVVIRIPLFGIPIAIILQKITWLFINTGFGKKVSKTTSANFPIGYMMVAKKIIKERGK